jgi:phytol kinase
MEGGGFLNDVILMALCYGYVLLMIFVSGRLEGLLKISRRASRKFLHAMIGNLPLVIPFFSWRFTPFLVAAPFIAVTFAASPYSPFRGLREGLRGLSDLTEEGHHLGLILYSISYTLLALLFAPKPYVIAAGVLPMAYGDSAAALVGERYGGSGRRLVGDKTLEGSLAMFAASFLGVAASLAFFSFFYPFAATEKLVQAVAVAIVVTVVECLSPRGFDNLTVPLLGAMTFLLVDGWL